MLKSKTNTTTRLNSIEQSPLNDPIFRIQINPLKKKPSYRERSTSKLSTRTRKVRRKTPVPKGCSGKSYINKKNSLFEISQNGYLQSTVCSPRAESSYTSIFYSKRKKKIEKKADICRPASPCKNRLDFLRASLSRDKPESSKDTFKRVNPKSAKCIPRKMKGRVKSKRRILERKTYFYFDNFYSYNGERKSQIENVGNFIVQENFGNFERFKSPNKRNFSREQMKYMEKKFRSRRSEQPKVKESNYLTILPVNNKRLSISRASSKPSLHHSNHLSLKPNRSKNRKLPNSFLAVNERLLKTTYKTFDQDSLAENSKNISRKSKELCLLNSSIADKRLIKPSRDASVFSAQASSFGLKRQNMMYSISSFNSGMNKDFSTFRLKTNLNKLRSSFFETESKSENRSSKPSLSNSLVKTIKYKSGIKDGILLTYDSDVKLALCYLHKIFQICLCRAFSDIKHFKHPVTDYSRVNVRRARIPRILPKREKKVNEVNNRRKVIRGIFRMIEAKSETRLRLGYLKLKINKLRRNRKVVQKMNPYITLSVTLRQIVLSKIREPFKKMKVKKNLSLVHFLKVNESTILPNITSDQIEYYSDISFPSIINALNLAQHKQNGEPPVSGAQGKNCFPCPENIARSSPRRPSNFYVEHQEVKEVGYNGFSLSSFKASKMKFEVSLKETNSTISYGVSKVAKMRKDRLFDAFRYGQF